MLPMLMLMPVLQLVLFGYVVGSDVKNLQLAVLDYDHTVQSERVVEAFTSSGYFTLAARPTNEAGVKNLLDGGTAVIAIEIPKGLSDSIRARRPAQIGIVVDMSRTNASSAGTIVFTARMVGL